MSDVHVRLRIGGEVYAVPVGNVREVAELGALSSVPGAGDSVLGVRNLHGQVLAVFDLARVLSVARGAGTQRMVVAEHEGRLAGLAVDEISDVAELSGDGQEAEADHLAAAVLEHGQLVGIIDVESLFGSLAREAA